MFLYTLASRQICRRMRLWLYFIHWCKQNMNDFVLTLAPKFTRLQTLILRQDKAQLEDNAVETIANFCYDIRELDLSKRFKLTDRSLYALAHGCPNLTKLNIGNVGGQPLTGHCRPLHITAANCRL